MNNHDDTPPAVKPDTSGTTAPAKGKVVIRTFLGWLIIVELEGRWPWQRKAEAVPATGGERQPRP